MSSERDSIILVPACESCLDSVFIEGDLLLPQKWEYAFLWISFKKMLYDKGWLNEIGYRWIW